jgi:hypothetical protein
MISSHRRFGIVLALLVFASIPATVSATHAAGAADNQRPSVQFTQAPAPMSSAFYAQRFSWSGTDPDGSVVSYRWAIDPSPVDTFWNNTPDTTRIWLFVASTPETPYAGPGLPQFCSDVHTVVVKSVDDLGLESPAEARPFIARNQAPGTLITSPSPSPSVFAPVPSTILVDWTGNDPDGLWSALPGYYKYKLARRETIQSALGIGMSSDPSEAQLRQYFLLEAPGFQSWDTAARESSQTRYTNLTLGGVYYFAVVGFDEALGWDPRFSRSTNVLAMQVTSVADVPGAGAMELSFAPPNPNPAHRGVTFNVTMPRGGDARLDIFDTVGRRVRALVAGRREGGRHAIAWDLMGDSGKPVPPGAYLARFMVDGEARIRRVIVMR